MSSSSLCTIERILNYASELKHRTISYDEFVSELRSKLKSSVDVTDFNYMIEYNKSFLQYVRSTPIEFATAFRLVNDEFAFVKTIVSIDMKLLHLRRGYVAYRNLSFEGFVIDWCEHKYYTINNNPGEYYMNISAKRFDVLEIYIDGISLSEISVALGNSYSDCSYKPLRDNEIVLPIVSLTKNRPWLHLIQKDHRPITFRIREYDVRPYLIEPMIRRVDNIELKDSTCYVEDGTIHEQL